MASGTGILKGAAWTAVSRYTLLLTQFATSTILSRILLPSDFGTLTMVTVITTYISLFADAGVGSAIVQKQEISPEGISSIYWLNLVVAAVLAVLFGGSGPVVAAFYGRPELTALSRVVSLSIFLVGVMTVPVSLMRRDLRFKEIALAEIASAIAAAITGVVLALNGFGYWALVVQMLLSLALKSGLVIWMADWKPKLVFSFTDIKPVLSFSGGVLGFNSINYWARNADNLLIGKQLGAGPLGFYNMAYTLMMFPLKILTAVIDPVLHPALAKLQANLQEVRRQYLLVVQAIGYLSIPLALGMWVAAEPLIVTVWGARWTPAIPVFRVLAVLATVQPIVSTTGSAFMARNRADLLFYIGSFNAVVMVGGIVAGLRWGILGVAWGYAIGYSLIAIPTMWFVVVRLLEGSLTELAGILAQPVACGGAVAVGEFFVMKVLAHRLPVPVELVLTILTAAMILLLFLWFFQRGAIVALLRSGCGTRLGQRWGSGKEA